jgi:hypothetical protein
MATTKHSAASDKRTAPTPAGRTKGSRARQKSTSQISAPADTGAAELKKIGRQRVAASGRIGRPGGDQLPQGGNAYRAAIMELIRQKSRKISGRPAQEILKILLRL